MKRYLFIILASICACFFSHAQILTPVSINNLGRSVITGGIIYEDNLGSLAINTFSTPTFIYTQGFLQPDAGTTSVVPFINDVSLGNGLFLMDAMGTTFENFEDNAYLEFSLGEVVSKTMTNGSIMLTQGILQPYKGKFWTGLVNTQWQNPGNWSPTFVPTSDDDVIIPPNCIHFPVLTNGVTGYCNSLELRTGSRVDVLIGGMIQSN